MRRALKDVIREIKDGSFACAAPGRAAARLSQAEDVEGRGSRPRASGY